MARKTGLRPPGKNVARETTRPCPVCEDNHAVLLFHQAFQSLDRGGPVQAYDVVACNLCGTCFADGIPAQEEFNEYYRKLSKYEYAFRQGKESEDDSFRLKKLAELVQSFIPDKSARILEIGCANGRLLAYLKQAGYEKVTGVDPSSGCARAAKELYNISVETGTVFDLSEPEIGYDLVITLGVLEHIQDVKCAVGKIRHVLSKKGRVFVGVPDASHLIAAQDAPFQEFSTEHINFFSPISLRYLMEAGGFRALRCKSLELELHRGFLTPTVCGVFENSEEFRTQFQYDNSTKEGLAKYINECKAADVLLKNRIREAVAGRTVIVWGVGTHTRRLLANHALRPEDIALFIDSNPNCQGQQFVGVPVVSPHDLTGRREPILISSYAFQEEIREEIRGNLHLHNEVIVLYDLKNRTVSNAA
jgi:SAM-dependent methyltransferase